MDVLLKAPAFSAQHPDAALVTLVSTQGSTPRHVGTRMLVSADGSFVGTIGGGRVELEVVQCAVDIAQNGGTAHATHNLVRDLGMCCGGTMTFFFEPLKPCLAAIEMMIARQDAREASWVATDLESGGMTCHVEAPLASERPELIIPVLPKPRLVLMGCGHLSRAIGPLAVGLEFEVVVCDDNETAAIDETLPWAERVVPSFERRDVEAALGPLGAADYVLVLTRDHGIDQRIVEAFLPHVDSLAYLGLIGSLGKIGRFRKRILAKGIVSEEQWQKLHGPIGLDIAAETPLEIAVSILAQLVRIKNTSQSGRDE